MLNATPLAEFERDGIVRLPAAFGADAAANMREVIWRELATRHSIERDRPETWPQGAAWSLKNSKRSRVFDSILSPAVVDALDALFGAGRWQSPKNWGNVLVTFPDAEEWTVPHRIWHSDFPPTLRPDQVDVVKVWAVCSGIQPGGGGTPQLAGSHRLFARWLAANPQTDYKRAKLGFLQSHPWLRSLSKNTDELDAAARISMFTNESDVDGLPARVVETTGEPGDVWITHPWVFHSIAVNADVVPRMQRSAAIWRRAPEFAA